jgi:hypothetical protein
MFSKALATLTAAAVLAVAGQAAAVTFSFAPGSNVPGVGFSPTAGFTVVDAFNTAADLAPITSGSLYGLYGPGTTGNAADPAFPVGDGTSFLGVLGGGFANITFLQPFTGSFQFDWGSVDTYNTFTIHRLAALDVVIVPGTDFPEPTSGNQFLPSSNGVFTVNSGADTITGISFASSQNSFEIDNFAIQTGRLNPLIPAGVPEPSAWALMILGFGATGAMLRRHRTEGQAVV